MYFLIVWNEKKYLAKILEDYKIAISIDGRDVPLDQCKECGVWKSEDEELYGDGFCDKCAALCIHCELYFNAKDMIPPEKDGEEYVCTSCNNKKKSEKE